VNNLRFSVVWCIFTPTAAATEQHSNIGNKIAIELSAKGCDETE